MVKYLFKLVVEMLPSVVATVIGAYIVAHYINPRAETPKAAAVATAPAGEARDLTKDAIEATGAIEDKAAEAKPAEVNTARTDKAKDEAKAKPAKVDDKKADEKKNALELARAAIERLRGTTVDTPAPAASQPVRTPAEIARTDDGARVAVQAPAPQRGPVVTAGPAPQPAPPSVAAPPLPPPVIVASPYGRHSVGPEAASADQPVDQARADRPTPPADIPLQRGTYDLQAQAAAPVEHVSIADHVLSTTKSFFRALTPNTQSN